MPKKPKNTHKKVLDPNFYSQTTSEDSPMNSRAKMRSLDVRKLEALEFLNGTTTPKHFLFRQQEIEEIEAFLECCLRGNRKGHKILMMTGSPGAGKTLSANSIFSKKECKIIKLNANIIKTRQEVQEILCEQLLPKKTGRDFSTLQIVRALQQKCPHCILYIEEIEILFKSAANILSEDFFSLFKNPKLNLVLVGISNTIDALQKYSDKLAIKVEEIKNVVFKPYSPEQIMDIIKSKITDIEQLTGIKISFPDSVLKYASYKLQSYKKGDFRIALEFLKEVVQRSFQKNYDPQENCFRVTIGCANQVFTKMSSCRDILIESLPFQQQIILISLFINIKRTDALAVTMKSLVEDVKWVCESIKLTYTKKLIDDGLSELEQYCMVVVSKKNNETRMTLKVSLNQIAACFSDHPIFKRFFDDK